MKTEVDDWLTELPPLDGDDEPETGDQVGDDPLPEPDDASSLDDSLADDLDVGVGIDLPDDEPHHDPARSVDPGRAGEPDDERWEADVGEPELDLADHEPLAEADGEPPASTDGDFGDHEELPSSEDDSGEEGTTDPIEHSLDEELPAMDADDEGDFEDKLLLEAGEVASDPETLRWADAAWSESSSAGETFAQQASDDDPLVTLTSLHAVDLIVGVARSGSLWVSRDGGQTASCARGRFQHLLGRGEAPFVALTAAQGGPPLIWVSCPTGQLAVSEDLGDSFRPCAGTGHATMALASREDGSVVALVKSGATIQLLTSADGTTWFGQSVSGDIVALASSKSPRARWMACRGIALAVGDRLGALQARDGRRFVRVAGTAGATAGAFAGPDASAPLVVSGCFGEDDEVHLARAPHDGRAEIVAEVAQGSAEGGDRAVLELSWIEKTGAVRVLLANGTARYFKRAKASE